MLKTFRVAELQELLGYANRSKSGRKHQLLGRALEMLKCDPGVNVRSKIRELYGNRYPRRLYVPRFQPTGTFSSVGEPSRNITILPSSLTENTPSPSLPVHPDVKLRPLPFYDFKDVLVRPNTLGECKDWCQFKKWRGRKNSQQFLLLVQLLTFLRFVVHR